MIEEILEQFGLSDKEVKIYLTLLKEGKSVVSDIAKKARINRSTVYVLLESLIAKGLVNTTEENKVKQYAATPPSGLTRSLEETIEGKNKLLKDLQKALPDLEALYRDKEIMSGGGKPEIKYYEGIAGLKTIYDSVMQAKGEMLIFSASTDKTILAKKYFDNYYTTIQKRTFETKIITSNKQEIEKFVQSKHLQLLAHKEVTEPSVELIILPMSVVVISLENQYGYVFDNAAFAKINKQLFTHTWNELERVSSGTKSNLIKIDALKKIYGLNNVYILDESKNDFGTIKDKRSLAISNKAKKFVIDKLVLVTSGNSGLSLAEYLKESQVKLVCIVDKNAPQEMKKELSKKAHQVIEINLEKRKLRTEEIITLAREHDDEVIWDVTNGYEDIYGTLVDGIVQMIIPDYIVVPVGRGEIFVGMAQAIERLGLKTKLIGVKPKDQTSGIADKLSRRYSPYTRLMQNLTKQRHELIEITDDEIGKLYEEYHHFCRSEPSSTIVYAALSRYKFKKDAIIVFVNYGRSKFSSRSDSRFFLTHFGE